MHFIDGPSVEAAADLAALIRSMQEAFRTGARAHTQVPLRLQMRREQPYAQFGVMPAYSETEGVFVAKLATLVPGAEPTVKALVAIFSALSVPWTPAVWMPTTRTPRGPSSAAR